MRKDGFGNELNPTVSLLLQLKDKQTVVYDYFNPKRRWGRTYCDKPSLQILSKNARNKVTPAGMFEFDIINCYPRLLVHICKKYGIPCKMWDSYVENRKDWLSDIAYEPFKILPDLSMRVNLLKSAKEQFIDALFDNDPGIGDIEKFRIEAEHIKDALWDLPNFAEERTFAQHEFLHKIFEGATIDGADPGYFNESNKKMHSTVKNHFLFLVLTRVEEQMLKIMYQNLTEIYNRKVVSLAYDGLFFTDDSYLHKVSGRYGLEPHKDYYLIVRFYLGIYVSADIIDLIMPYLYFYKHILYNLRKAVPNMKIKYGIV